MIALILQIAGFALAILFLILHHCDLFVVAFGVHVAGDALFIAQNGFPTMSLSSLLDSFEQNVKIAPWLQFVGYMLAFGGLLLIGHSHQVPGKLLAYIGLGISFAGYLYHRIYP